MDNKSIEINQRIPLNTLYAALESLLNGSYSSEYILEQLRLEFNGENRLKKALRIVNKIIQNNTLNDFLLLNADEIKNTIKRKNDRNLILIALLNSAFPFSFDVLKTFGKYFLVQDIVSTETIKRPISNIYGGNRATGNGLYSVVPMFLEAGLFTRQKPGIYLKNLQSNSFSSIAKKVYIESYKINTRNGILNDYHLLEPYFVFMTN